MEAPNGKVYHAALLLFPWHDCRHVQDIGLHKKSAIPANSAT